MKIGMMKDKRELIVCYRNNGKTISAEIIGELVRCKNCKWWKHFRGGLGNCKHHSATEKNLTENYHFCGYGARKGAEQA